MDSSELTDDYVANLLVADAKSASIKYSALGLEGLLTSKPPANKPKPNTRFLRNIIKDTDSHNAALLAKEAAESSARLQNLSSNKYRQEKSSQIGGAEIRKRQLGAIAAHISAGGGESSRSRRSRDAGTESSTSSRRRADPSDHDLIRHGRSDPSSKSYGRLKEDLSADERDDRRRHERHRSRSPRRKDGLSRRHRGTTRSRSPRERRHRSRERHHRKRSPHRRRSRTRSLSRSRDSRHKGDKRDEMARSRRLGGSDMEIDSTKKAHQHSEQYLSDSDPLDDIIGPQPPPPQSIPLKSRGRGTISSLSGIDDRFSANYDPKLDVQMDTGDADGNNNDDWDQALEALHDRVKWQQQGAERLRAAGFSEAEIGKWEKSGDGNGERAESDVRWAKKGESREWDKGKVFDEDGIVVTQSNWGRLKGT